VRFARLTSRLALAALGLLAACARPALERPAAPAALRVATTGDYAPFSSTDAAGQRRGLDVEVAARLATDIGQRLAWVAVTWPTLDAATARDAYDVAMSGITMRADRAIVGRFTRPYATTGAVAIVRAGDAARLAPPSALDRPGMRLAVNAGGHLERLTRLRFPRATILPQAANALVPAALRSGAADAAISDTAEARGWLAPGLVALAPFSVDYKAYLLPVEQAALATRVDAWLMAREADGWLNAARVRWLGDGASRDAAAAARQAVAGLVRLRLDLMPAVAAAKRAADLPIEDREQEARVLDRVRARVPSAPARAVAVYAVLIETAKTVQRTAPAVAAPPSLDALRAALGRIDETLCRELERLPPATIAEWRMALAPALGDGVAVRQLSDALADTPRL